MSPLVPFILTWRKDYKVKSWLKTDIIAGFTIAFMGIPQGLAYAKLANVDTVYGTWDRLVPFPVEKLRGGSCVARVRSQVTSCFCGMNALTASVWELSCGIGVPSTVPVRYLLHDVPSSVLLPVGLLQASGRGPAERALPAVGQCCCRCVCVSECAHLCVVVFAPVCPCVSVCAWLSPSRVWALWMVVCGGYASTCCSPPPLFPFASPLVVPFACFCAVRMC